MTYQNSPNGVNSSHPKVSKDALQSLELQKATKQWFSEIDADDRAVALGFVDGPIFSVFSKLALSSSKPSPIPNPNAGEPTTDKPKSKDYFIDWEAKVSFKDVEKLLREEMGLSDSVSRQNGVSSEYKQETTDSSINYPVESLAKGGGNAATEAEQYVEDVESDAFRIRGSDESATTTVTMKSEGGEEESGEENGKNTQESKKAAIPSISSENTKSPLARKVSDLMEKVCVIFPSAFNLVSSDAVQDFHPFITLQPSYLRSINGEDLLFTFDEIMPTLASNSSTFLPDQLSNSSWIDAVRNYCDETLSIPLYMLLLLRFRNSVSHAFHKSASLNNGSARSENGDEEKKESSQSDSAPSKELYDVNGSLESAESHSIPTANGESKAADSHIWLLRSLLSRLSTMNSVESEKLGEISSPLLSYIPQLSQENHLLEDVLIIRLSTLTQCLKDVGPRIDEELRRINEAIHEVVQRASVDLPLGEAKQGKVLNTDVGSLATTTWNLDEKSGESFDGQFELQTTSSAASQSPTGKKNSKKKKKKKKRKSQGGGQQVLTKEGTTQIIENETNAGDKSDEVQISSLDNGGEKSASDVDKSFTSLDSIEENGATHAGDGNGGEDSASVNKGAIHGSKVVGVGTTGVVVAQPDANEGKKSERSEAEATSVAETVDVDDDDDSAWETVEVRSRGNRKKLSDRANGRLSSHQGNNGNLTGAQNGTASKKSKAPRTTNSRKKHAQRKMMREILSSVLDAVDDEVRRRQLSLSDESLTGDKWPAVTAKTKGVASSSTLANTVETQKQAGQKKETTMRDILVGALASSSKDASANKPAQKLYSDLVRQKPEPRANGKSQHGLQPNDKKISGKVDRPSAGVAAKNSGATVADQSTAPTVPETLSAVSAISGSIETPTTRNTPTLDSEVARSDSSSGEIGEALKTKNTQPQVGKEASLSPPLPTLLSPGNANSASSSVASSLDAPHVGHNHSFYPGNENDVGYHLLDVCNRLTRDINVFMKRRDHALTVRRRERGSVLVALQETLTSIWPGMCSVEMYGSCATQLDLPSSDLDVVVRGLDNSGETLANSSPKNSDHNVLEEGGNDEKVDGRDSDSDSKNAEENQSVGSPSQGSPPQKKYTSIYGQSSSNADRVLRLAMELERQPWAVQVKAIPTASVPVIKILADPARLSGNGEWLMQHTMSRQTTPVNAQPAKDRLDASTSPAGVPHFHSSQGQHPWRGADVVNGLLKVDITFEGPEHGGIGSTTFSSRVVQECSNEIGLPPESTPFVQVLMVLKELLAQRRLNEPFSGGLSSYALLLLVISVLRERSIIREELERVERQRRMVEAGGGNAALRSGVSDTATQHTSGSNGGTGKAKPISLSEDKRKPAENKAGLGASRSLESSRAVQTKSGNSKNEMNAPESSETQSEIPARQESTNGPAKKVIAGGSSWASIARKSAAPLTRKPSQESIQTKSSEMKSTHPKRANGKVSTFADAVTNGTAGGSTSATTSTSMNGAASKLPVSKSIEKKETSPKKEITPTKEISSKEEIPTVTPSSSPSTLGSNTQNMNGLATTQSKQNTLSSTDEPGVGSSVSVFPQGFHDVVEVLCSGETTPGKLLMHFLLFYGQHFESQSTAIDYSGTHQRDLNNNNGYTRFSPYMQRRNAGSYDPITGMLTVDPIVVYDPLEGAETNNVARSCFAWSNIRWVFAQSYMTLSSAVEMRASHSSGQGSITRDNKTSNSRNNGVANGRQAGGADAWAGPYAHEQTGNMMDPSSSLLELLLSV